MRSIYQNCQNNSKKQIKVTQQELLIFSYGMSRLIKIAPVPFSQYDNHNLLFYQIGFPKHLIILSHESIEISKFHRNNYVMLDFIRKDFQLI